MKSEDIIALVAIAIGGFLVLMVAEAARQQTHAEWESHQQRQIQNK